MCDILVVDDDTAIRRAFRAMLGGEGYAVRTARNASEASLMVAERRPDLVLLDVSMPKRNGFSLCEELRAADRTLPIIFLSALDGDLDKVRGLRAGADDYIVKTASDAEILARVRRALDRVESFRDAGEPPLRLGRVEVDFAAMTVSGDGVRDRLTPSECAILRMLAASRGEYLSAADLAGSTGDDDESEASVAVRSHLSRLKVKLGAAGALILNRRGLGYKLAR